MDAELLKLLLEKGGWGVLLAYLTVRHWRRRKAGAVAPDERLALKRVLNEIGELFGEIADNESAARERHRETMEGQRALDERLDKLERTVTKRLSA
jgi:hypothetical protein